MPIDKPNVVMNMGEQPLYRFNPYKQAITDNTYVNYYTNPLLKEGIITEQFVQFNDRHYTVHVVIAVI